MTITPSPVTNTPFIVCGEFSVVLAARTCKESFDSSARNINLNIFVVTKALLLQHYHRFYAHRPPSATSLTARSLTSPSAPSDPLVSRTRAHHRLPCDNCKLACLLMMMWTSLSPLLPPPNRNEVILGCCTFSIGKILLWSKRWCQGRKP